MSTDKLPGKKSAEEVIELLRGNVKTLWITPIYLYPHEQKALLAYLDALQKDNIA